MIAPARVPAGSPTGGQFAADEGREASPLAFGPSDDFGRMPANTALALIDHRVAHGGRADESEVLLRQLLASHYGDNLVHALSYEAFGTARRCQRAVDQSEGETL